MWWSSPPEAERSWQVEYGRISFFASGRELFIGFKGVFGPICTWDMWEPAVSM